MGTQTLADRHYVVAFSRDVMREWVPSHIHCEEWADIVDAQSDATVVAYVVRHYCGGAESLENDAYWSHPLSQTGGK